MHAKEAKEFASFGPEKKLITASPELAVIGAVERMREFGIHHLIVMRDDKCLGVLSSRDLVFEKDGSREIHELMRQDILLVDEETDLKTALAFMVEHGLTALPLTSRGKVTGILTESDLLRVLGRFIDGHARVGDFMARGEAAVAHPFVQNFAKALSDAGI